MSMMLHNELEGRTYLLYDELGAEVKASQSHATKDYTTHETGGRDARIVRKDPKHSDSCNQHSDLLAAKPKAHPHWPDLADQPRRYPRCENFQADAESPGNANLGGAVARREQVGDHLAGEAENGKV